MDHKTVLLEESVIALKIKKNGIYVDCTLGGGGHSELILKKLEESGKLIAIDQDSFAIEKSKERLKEFNNIIFVKDNFSNFKNILDNLNIEYVDGVLLDLGVSSFQFDDRDRGFSYWDEAVLDMRMDQDAKIDAKFIINNYTLKEITRVFTDYGEEKNAYRFAKAIIKAREVKEIVTNKDLIDILKLSLSEKEKRKQGHPARKIFQALRIEVNQELKVLEDVLPLIVEKLNPKGRLAIITFHSIEDRIVKKFIKKMENPCECPPDFPICICGKVPLLKSIGKKPILPNDDEVDINSRARSSKLRIAEKI
ncbi:MAG: 16S rRNA (cytosine(1402)-N(4))-methyltransferase RsmH [Firmicutes bacterium]|nr:16S rRNA (cytosine(1402)-N(4))-methyltransferase RsmH [Bacillota bacterium]